MSKWREIMGVSCGEKSLESPDMINHPPHYNNSPAHCACGRRIECIDVVRHLPFALGNAIKYLWRFQDKGGLEDLKKARWYLEDHIRQREKHAPVDTGE